MPLTLFLAVEMSPLVGVVIFFVIFAGLPVSFALYVIYVKGWPFRKLTPYMIVYAGAFGALMGWGMRLRGWDLAAAVALAMGLMWLAMASRTGFIDGMLRASRRKESK